MSIATTIPTTTLTETITSSTTSGTTRAVVYGAQDGGAYVPIPVSSDRHLQIAAVEPASIFAEVRVVEPTPRTQIDAVNGILTTDVETLTDGVSGSVTASGSLFSCATGTSVGGYGVVRSRRLIRSNAGQGAVVRFTTMYPDAGVANCFLMSGAFNSEDGIFVGYSGTTFGALRRIGGTAAIVRLTVTVGAGGAETLTITLNAVPFTVDTGGVLSTSGVAEAIAERVGGYTGWSNAVSPTSNGATVTFIQNSPATAAGAYTLTSTGTATGTFATLQSGSANDNVTGFVAQTAWNVDRLNGAGGQYNPSGVLLDPAKLNIWELRYGDFDTAPIELRYMSPGGDMVTVHRFQLPNSLTTTSFRNPCLRVGWVAASLGSTSALTVRGGSAVGFVDGMMLPPRDPYSYLNGSFAASVTEYVALALRVRGEFGSTLNLRESEIVSMMVGCETNARLLVARLVLNPVMTGTVNWAYVGQSISSMEYATPTTVAATGGQLIAAILTGTSIPLDLGARSIRMEPGDVVALCIATVSSTATAACAISWLER